MDVHNFPKTFSPQRPGWAQLNTHTHACRQRRTQWQAATNTVLNMDQSRVKPKFHRCENMDRVMSKKKWGENQNPREGCFMRWNGKQKSAVCKEREFLGAHTESWGFQLPHLSVVLVCCAFPLPSRSRWWCQEVPAFTQSVHRNLPPLLSSAHSWCNPHPALCGHWSQILWQSSARDKEKDCLKRG